MVASMVDQGSPGGTMIEAPHSGTTVRYAPVYRSDLVGVGRPG